MRGVFAAGPHPVIIIGSRLRSSRESRGKKMSRARLRIQRFFMESSGATAVEYAFVAAGIALVIIASVAFIGKALLPIFGGLTTGLGG